MRDCGCCKRCLRKTGTQHNQHGILWPSQETWLIADSFVRFKNPRLKDHILNLLFVSKLRLKMKIVTSFSWGINACIFLSRCSWCFFSVLVFCVDGVSIYSLFSNVPQFYSFSFCHAWNYLEMRTERHWYIWRLWAPRCCAWSFAAQLHSSMKGSSF